MSLQTADHHKIISDLTKRHLGQKGTDIERFPTGLTHFVYDVKLSDNRSVVVRLATGQNRQELQNGLYWQPHLASLGVRLPEIYGSGEIDDMAYAILERLPGNDIEVVYPQLSASEKQSIAIELAQAQAKVGKLNLGLFNFEFRPCLEMAQLTCRRSENGFKRLGRFDIAFIERLREAFGEIPDELNQLPPTPYLYDTSLKNVIIHDGTVSGFIDVDEVWVGDPLLAIGRCKSLLILREWGTDLYDYWVAYLNLTEQEKYRTELYAALYCVRCMSLLGDPFNGNIQIENNLENAARIESITRNHLSRIGLTL